MSDKQRNRFVGREMEERRRAMNEEDKINRLFIQVNRLFIPVKQVVHLGKQVIHSDMQLFFPS